MVRFDCDKATGKSAILIYGNPVKPQIKKYFAFPEMQTGLYPTPSRPDQRGARDRHERGTGMRWTRKLRLTSAADAYGKDVWSRRRGAGVNAPGGNCFQGATEAKEPFSREITL